MKKITLLMTLLISVTAFSQCVIKGNSTMKVSNTKSYTIDNAMKLLNGLLIKRWKTETFVPFVVNGKDEALALIVKERRKELIFRGLRWADLKRYNRDGANIKVSRAIANKVYTLPPNDPRYAIAIPEDIIKMTGMPQNPR